jgi:hypothetical protein
MKEKRSEEDRGYESFLLALCFLFIFCIPVTVWRNRLGCLSNAIDCQVFFRFNSEDYVRVMDSSYGLASFGKVVAPEVE